MGTGPRLGSDSFPVKHGASPTRSLAVRALGLFLLLLTSACQHPAPSPPPAAATTAPRPSHNIRTLRAELPGLSMREVVRKIGRPSQVFTIGARETWDYHNIAFDPVTGRTVSFLELVFQDRRVQSVNFSY